MLANRPVAALGLASAVLVFTASCAERQPPPPPPPVVRPSPLPPPPPPPVPQADWRDMPQTPGNWTWSMEGGRSTARFGGDVLTVTCDRATGAITFARTGIAEGQVPMTVVTEAVTRPVTGLAQAGPAPVVTLSFTSSDPILDAMAFSRGRFALEATGLPTLYLPSWPELSRVIEDCR